jgi:hypothetical protein
MLTSAALVAGSLEASDYMRKRDYESFSDYESRISAIEQQERLMREYREQEYRIQQLERRQRAVDGCIRHYDW